MFLDKFHDIADVIPRIDDHPFAGGLVPNDRTVALKRSDGEDFVNHSKGVMASATYEV
jgi:hypothetical protein